MTSRDLLQHWQENFGEAITSSEYTLKLNTKDAARIEALCEMFPSSNKDQILRDLISAALTDLTSGFPYRAGQKDVAQDEEGDPIYEDVGPTPRFLNLTRKHMNVLQKQSH